MESFYTSLQNPKNLPKEQAVNIFLSPKLSEEELALLRSRNSDYLNTFFWYQTNATRSDDFENDMKKIEKSSDPESIFSFSAGDRWTSRLESLEEFDMSQMTFGDFNALISSNSELFVRSVNY